MKDENPTISDLRFRISDFGLRPPQPIQNRVRSLTFRERCSIRRAVE